MITLLEAIDGELKKNKDEQRFAVFDFDNTCIANDIQEALFAFMCKHFLIRNNTLAENFEDKEKFHKNVFIFYYSLLEKGDIRGAYAYVVRTLAGFTNDEISKLTHQTIQEEGEVLGKKTLFGIEIANGLKLRDKVVSLMKSCSDRGIAIWVVTASSEPLVKAILEYYRLPAECVGVRLKENDGVFADIFIEPFSIIEGKVLAIKKYINENTRPILGIGDSMNDFPMLEYSKIKVIVNRNNQLTREAEERGWYILE